MESQALLLLVMRTFLQNCTLKGTQTPKSLQISFQQYTLRLPAAVQEVLQSVRRRTSHCNIVKLPKIMELITPCSQCLTHWSLINSAQADDQQLSSRAASQMLSTNWSWVQLQQDSTCACMFKD